MRKLILLFNCFIVGLLAVLFFGIVQSFAQTSPVGKTPEQIAAEHGVTFPIAELGNCSDFNACRTFCEDPVNKNTCIDFAKKKGFYKEETTAKKDEIIKSAKDQLGCDSEDSCRLLCSQEANYDKCSGFAQKNNLGGGQVHDPSKAEILKKAKDILGCDSPSSCRSFCEQEANRQECSNFANQTGLRGGEHQAGPGGCTSQETCKAFCSDPANFQICSKFQSTVTGEAKNFQGPGGCNSEESCRTYCQSHPNECGYYGGSGDQDKAKAYADFCRQNPEKCKPGQSGGFESSQKREEFEKFCRENPDKCQGFPTPSGNINPNDYCKQYPEKCNFQSPNPSYSPYPTYNPTNTFYPSYSPYPTGGTGGYNYPSPTSYPSGYQQPTSTNYPSSTFYPSTTYQPSSQQPTYQQPTSTSYPQAVRGASTQSFFQTILQILLRL